MTTIAHTTATAASAPRRTGFFGWILSLDAAYRQKQALKRATDDQLADMGLTRKNADEAFLTQLRDNRWTPRG